MGDGVHAAKYGRVNLRDMYGGSRAVVVRFICYAMAMGLVQVPADSVKKVGLAGVRGYASSFQTFFLYRHREHVRE